MRIAIVHDYFNTIAGSEKVALEMLQVFPKADLFTLFYSDGFLKTGLLPGNVQTSFIQHLPFARRRHRLFYPLMMIAIEQLDLRGYDIVISSHHTCAMGVITAPETCHVSYVYTPMRFSWDLRHEYYERASRVVRFFSPVLLNYLRLWEVQAAQRVDHLMTLSQVVQTKIAKYYSREAEIIYPQVDTDFYAHVKRQREDFFLIISRLTAPKNVGLAVQAFNQNKLPLVVIGTGPQESELRGMAQSSIRFLGFQPDTVVREYAQRCQALVFPTEDDFGIVPVEAQACGAPVLAYGRGGALETVIEGETGLFFYENTVDSLCQAVRIIMERNWDHELIRRNAERFGKQRFRTDFKESVLEAYQRFQNHGPSSTRVLQG